jgi:hypothetical protein
MLNFIPGKNALFTRQIEAWKISFGTAALYYPRLKSPGAAAESAGMPLKPED